MLVVIRELRTYSGVMIAGASLEPAPMGARPVLPTSKNKHAGRQGSVRNDDRSLIRAQVASEVVLGFPWSLESRDLERADRLTRTRTSAGWRRWLSGERGVALIVSASFDAVDLAGRYLRPSREENRADLAFVD